MPAATVVPPPKTHPSYPRVTVMDYSSAMVGKVGQDGPGADRQQEIDMSLQEGSDDGPAIRWDLIRDEYEGRAFLPAIICKRYGITAAQLRYRRESEGWLSVRARVVRQDNLVASMLKVLDKQVRRLEMDKDMTLDKQAAILAIEVKTLDKLIELGAARPNVDPPTQKDAAGMLNKLTKRIDQFNSR